MAQYTQSVQEELHSGGDSVSTNYTAVTTDGTLITSPGSHKSIFVTDLIISNGDTAGYFFLQEDTAGTVVLNRQNLAINGHLVANYSQPLQITPNMSLTISSATADDFSVSINYYIDEVKGFGYTS